MIKRAALGAVFLAVVSIGVAYASAFVPGGAPQWAAWVMAVGIAVLMVATMALGAVRDDRLGRLRVPFAFVFLVLVAGFGVVLALPPANPADPDLWLGLPPRAAVVLYGIGLLPLLAVPLTYALTFDEMTLSDEDLRRVRAAAAQLRSAPVGGPPSSAVASGEARVALRNGPGGADSAGSDEGRPATGERVEVRS